MRSIIAEFFILLFSLVDFTLAVKKCLTICPDLQFNYASQTIEEILISNLQNEIDPNCICPESDKWFLNGTMLGLSSGNICLDIPVGQDIKPGQGEKCPNSFKCGVEETLYECHLRTYELLGENTPSDGWCAEGEIKWIIDKNLLGISSNICTCLDDFDITSPDVVCI
ncbi:CLUMA_CG000467, isoform A [Clunio marinus]|uniref:CLUMA_CG000467, isoform A n=1 Tax=Clunio marinus TaxID=568069 RepID=A0A1J1HF86_9DIPT|nr:CLUMA_CG000467, isoform A [Clunio marinus]